VEEGTVTVAAGLEIAVIVDSVVVEGHGVALGTCPIIRWGAHWNRLISG